MTSSADDWKRRHNHEAKRRRELRKIHGDNPRIHQKVRCPMRACDATAGEPCVGPTHLKGQRKPCPPHTRRVRKAIKWLRSGVYSKQCPTCPRNMGHDSVPTVCRCGEIHWFCWTCAQQMVIPETMRPLACIVRPKESEWVLLQLKGIELNNPLVEGPTE